VSDPRYGTNAWKRTRRAILRRDGHQCLIQGPGCLGYATTVHHLTPSSVAPDLFYASDNLVSACTRCNYAHGARLKTGRRSAEIAAYKQLIEDQWRMIAELHDRVGQLEAQLEQRHRANPPQKRREPAIY
jgi:hypothetical protein